MGRFNDFAKGGVEIELTGGNPPDVAAITEAAASEAAADSPSHTGACSLGGAAWTPILK